MEEGCESSSDLLCVDIGRSFSFFVFPIPAWIGHGPSHPDSSARDRDGELNADAMLPGPLHLPPN